MGSREKPYKDDVASDAPSLEVVRIYFNKPYLVRRDPSLWERFTKPLAAVWLAREALKGGITFAVVTIGAAGFVRGARQVEVNMPEVISEKLPSCLELVGHKSRIVRFLEAQASILEDAVVIRMHGQVVVCSAAENCKGSGQMGYGIADTFYTH